MAILCLNNNWALYHLDGTIDSTTTGELLLHFNNSLEDSGTSNSVVTDPGTYNYAPAYVTSTAPLTSSTHALYLNTSDNFGDFLVIPTSVELQWPGDFTVDFWMKWGSAAKVSSTTWMSIISSDITAGSYGANVGTGLTLAWSGANRAGYERIFDIAIAKSETNTTNSTHNAYAQFEYYGSGTNPAHRSDADLITDFHHIAICRTDGLIEMWMGGKKLTVVPASLYNSDSTTELVAKGYVNSYSTNGTPYHIGRSSYWINVADNTTIHANDFHGYIDELRFVRGRAEFSGATFTVPAEIHGLDRTSLNNNNPFGQAGELELVGTPLPALNSSVKQFSSDSSINLDGKNGLVLPYSSTETDFGAGPFTIDFWVYYDTANHPSGERTLLAHGTDLTLTYDGSPVGHDVGNLLLHLNSTLGDFGSGAKTITAPGANNSAPIWTSGKFGNAIHLDVASGGDFLRIPYSPSAGVATLFHFDDNVTDLSGSGNHGTATSITYAASGAGASGTGFGKAAVFDGSSNTGGGDSYVIFDDMGIGAGDFTIEFWVKFDSVLSGTDYHNIVCTDALAGGVTPGHFAIFQFSALIWVYYSTGSGSTYNYLSFAPPTGLSPNTWYHMAVCRNGTSYEYYWGAAGVSTGAKITSFSANTTSATAYTIGGASHKWVLGRHSDGVTNNIFNLTGQLDEFLITKVAKYTGATYPIPTAPYKDDNDLEWDGDFTVDFWIKFDASTFTSSDYHMIIATDERSLPSPDDLGFNFGWHGSAHASVPRTFFVSMADSTNLLRASTNLNYYGPGILFHFDGDVTDSSGSGNHGTNTGVTFVPSGVLGFTGGQAGVFDGSAETSGGDDYVIFDDPGIGTGDFTIEWFWRRDLSTAASSYPYKDSPFSINGSGFVAGGFGMYVFSTTTCKVYYWDAGGPGFVYDQFTLPSHAADAWCHVRLVRSGTSHHYYWNGTRIGSAVVHTAHSIGGVGQEWVLGRLLDGTTYPEYNLKGQMEEFRITKTALSTGATFPIPAAPGAHVSDADMQGNFNHIAICRTNILGADGVGGDGGVVQAWLNGIEMTQTSVTNSDYTTPAGTTYELLVTSGIVNSYKMDMYIGRDVQFAKIADDVLADAHDFSGKIDEFRIIKGTAMYSGADWSADLPLSYYGSTTADTLTTTIEGVSSSATGVAISRNAWHHFGIVRDTGGSVKTYLDGVLKTTIANVYQILYDFNGNINDSSGHGRHGTTNSTTYTTSYAGNIGNWPQAYNECNAGTTGAWCPDRGYGKSLELNGTSELVTFPDTAIRKGDYTIEFWMKHDAAAVMAMVSCGYNSANSNLNTYEMSFRLHSSSWFHEKDHVNGLERKNYFADPATGTYPTQGTAGWRHYTIEREYIGNGLSIHRYYFDGHELNVKFANLEGSFSVQTWPGPQIYPPADVNPTDDWKMGQAGTGYWWVNGQFDDFRISHYARYGGGNFKPPTAPHGTGSDNKKMILGHAQDEGAYIPFNNTTANLSSAIVRTPGPTNHNSYAGSTFSADSPYDEILFHFEDNLYGVTGHDGSIGAGTPTYATSSAAGSRNNATFGKAIDFNGSTHTTFPDPRIGAGSFTIEFFVNFDNANGVTGVPLSYYAAAAGPGYFQIHRHMTVWYIAFWDLATSAIEYVMSWNDTAEGEALVNNTWYHIAIVRNGTALSFYKDGVRKVHITALTTPHFIGGPLTWSIAQGGTSTSYRFNGKIDELRITKKAEHLGATYTIPTAPYAAPTTNYSLVKDVMGGTKSDYHHILGTPTFDGAFTIDFWMKMDGYSSGRLDSARTFTSIIGCHNLHQTSGTYNGENPWESAWMLGYRTIHDTSTWGLPNKFHLYQHQGGGSGLKSMAGCTPWSDAEVFDALESWNHIAIVRYTNAIYNTTSAETGWKVFINGRHWHHTSEPTSNCSQSGNGANWDNTTAGSASQIQDPAQRGWLFGGHNSSTTAGEDSMFGADNFSGKMAHLRMIDSAIFPGGGFAPPTLDSYPSSDTGIIGNIEEIRVVAGEDLSSEWRDLDVKALYHMDDDVDDSSGNTPALDATITGSPASGTQYVTSLSGFDKALRIQNANVVAVNWLDIPDPNVGTGPFTFEFFWDPISTALDQAILSCGSGTSDAFVLYTSAYGGADALYFYQGSDYLLWVFPWDAASGTMKHIALVRETASGGNSQWNLYYDGALLPFHAVGSAGTPDGNIATVDLAGKTFTIGRRRGGGGSHSVREGLFDEVQVSASDNIYPNPYTIPAAPHTPASLPTDPYPCGCPDYYYNFDTGSSELENQGPTTNDLIISGTVVYSTNKKFGSKSADLSSGYLIKSFAGTTGNINLHSDNNYTDNGSIGATVTAPGLHNSLTFDGTNKKFGTHSMFFDGNSGADSFVVIPYSDELKFEADFTVDFWVKYNADTDNNLFNLFIGPDRSAGGSSYRSGLQAGYYGVNGGSGNAGKYFVSIPNGSYNNYHWGLYSDGLSEAARLAAGFIHIAIVRDSSGGRFYSNGVRLTELGGGWELINTTVNVEEEPYMVGRRNDPPDDYDTQAGEWGLDGWIDELRFVKGTALFSGSSFNVPITAYNGIENMSGDFTIQMWLKFASTASTQIIFEEAGSSGNRPIFSFIGSGTAGAQTFEMAWEGVSNTVGSLTGHTVYGTGTSGINTTDWYHLSVTFSSGTIRTFFHGEYIGTDEDSSWDVTFPSSTNSTTSLEIGVSFTGLLDELIIIDGNLIPYSSSSYALAADPACGVDIGCTVPSSCTGCTPAAGGQVSDGGTYTQVGQCNDNSGGGSGGWNNNSTETFTCSGLTGFAGTWTSTSSCNDPDECQFNATRWGSATTTPVGTACGLNNEGYRQQVCTGSTPSVWANNNSGPCSGTDVCTNGQIDVLVCNGTGTKIRVCSSGAWGSWGACQDPKGGSGTTCHNDHTTSYTNAAILVGTTAGASSHAHAYTVDASGNGSTGTTNGHHHEIIAGVIQNFCTYTSCTVPSAGSGTNVPAAGQTVVHGGTYLETGQCNVNGANGGYNGDAYRTGTCNDGSWDYSASNGTCTDPDACIYDAIEGCEGTNCSPNCGTSPSESSVRKCASSGNSTWGAWSACQDTDGAGSTCHNHGSVSGRGDANGIGDTISAGAHAHDFDVDGSGNGWTDVVSGHHHKIVSNAVQDFCTLSNCTVPSTCNGCSESGGATVVHGGTYTQTGECNINGAAGGYNDNASEVFTCNDGTWSSGGCIDPDACTFNSIQGEVCDTTGTRVQVCSSSTVSTWGTWSDCQNPTGGSGSSIHIHTISGSGAASGTTSAASAGVAHTHAFTVDINRNGYTDVVAGHHHKIIGDNVANFNSTGPALITCSITDCTIVGACYTKEYGTVKLSWDIDNSEDHELTSIEIVRALSNNSIFPAKTVTLGKNYFKSGFTSPYIGEWTDTGLVLPMSCTAAETFTYTITLNSTAPGSAGSDSFTTGTITTPCCECIANDEFEAGTGGFSETCLEPVDLELLYKFKTGKDPYIKDETSNFNHGRARGGAIIDATIYSATSTSSLKIPGEGSYVSIPQHPSLDFGTDPFTIDFWIYFNIALSPEDSWSTIFQSANYKGNATGFRLTFNSGNYEVSSGVYNVPYFRYESGDNYVFSSSNTTTPQAIIDVTFPVVGTTTTTPPTYSTLSSFASKDWHHVRITRDAVGAIKLWLNSGALLASNTPSHLTKIYHGDDGIEIGSSKPGYPSFNGYIDNFRIQRADPGGTWTSNTVGAARTYFVGDCPELDPDPKCWDSQDSKLSIWMEGYFENPITGRASFDLKYYLNEKCAWGIGDSRIYFYLPNQANATAFIPNSLLSSTDCTLEEAFDGGRYPDRWKLDIAHPSGTGTSFYKEIYPLGYTCSNTKLLLKFDEPIDTNAQQDIPNYADIATATIEVGAGVEIDLVNKKFGTSSLKFKDEAGATPDVDLTGLGAELDFGTGSFTIDLWIYIEDQLGQVAAGQEILYFSFKNMGVSYRRWWTNAGAGSVVSEFRIGDIGSDLYQMTFYDIDDNHIKNKTWYHLAVTRESTSGVDANDDKIRFYRDGVELYWKSTTSSIGGSSTTQVITDSINYGDTRKTGYPNDPRYPTLGYPAPQSAGSAAYCFKGNMDEFRVSKGVARWISSLPLTPPGVPGRFTFNPPAATTACWEVDPKILLPPTHGSFGTIEFDKPIGQGRVCFDVDETKLEVWSRLVGNSNDPGYEESVTYDSTGNLAKDYNVAGLPKWQTGPCLSTCTDEVEMGYGDFYFKPKPYDNNTVDVEYCLTRDEANTFILACITTDFKTNVSTVDAEFGDAVDHGWDIKVKNICPGFSIVYGHGTEPITNSGYNTLIRLYLDNQVIQKHHSDPNTKVCMFPLFMSIDESLFATLDNYIAKLDSPEMKNLRDSKNAGGELSNNYETPSFYYNGAPYGSSYSSSANNLIEGWQKGSGFLADLHLIADKVDKRFKQLVHYLADAFEDVIKDHSNTDDYIAEDGIRNSAIETAHSFRILYLYWSSLLESYPELKSQFDSYSKDLVLTENDFRIIQGASPFLYKNPCLYRGLDVGFRCDSANKRVYVDILYNFPLSSISGVEINLKAMVSGLTGGVTISDIKSWDGDARNNNYLQAFSANTNKYICVYGGNISDLTSSPTNNYLRSDISQKTLPVLTTIVLAEADPANPHFDDFFLKCGEEWSSISSTGGMDDNMSLLYQNIITSLWTAKFVSNENTTDVVHYDDLPKWTGNSYKASIDDNLDVRDLLTTVMLAIEPNGSSGTANINLSETNIEAVIKLPIDAKQIGQTSGLKSVKEYYNLPSLNLTGITYSTISDAVNGKYPWVDSDSGKIIRSTIDVNNDGIIDIVDVVALRNVWTAIGEYPATLQQVENTILPIVPNNPCTVYDVNATLFSVDDCSTFCILDPDCFSKVWISDMILIRDTEDNPTNYLLEVSYSVDAQSRPDGMVLIPAGDFVYGLDGSEKTKTTEAFYIDTHEVTAGEYKECVDAGACTYSGGTPGDHTYNNGKDNHPINYVNWQEAVDFCTWKGKRLPTEIEWERAARGTDGRRYPWGDETATCNYAVMYEGGPASNYGCGTASTWEVGQKPNGVSPYGLYDMAGNVWEWTDSWYSSTTRVLRGGSFKDPALELRSSYRYNGSPVFRFYGSGFRCAQSLEVNNNNHSIEDFSGVQFRVEGLDGEGILGIETGTGTLDQVDATAAKAQEWSENILALDTIVNDSYYGFSTNGRYISKGKGVLCYLKISADSIPDREGVLKKHIAEGLIVTNKFKKFETNPIISALEDISGERVSYPLANLRFKSHHTDELMIYERFGIRLYDYKVTYNDAYDITDLTTAIDKKINTSPSWEGGTGATTASSLDYVLKLAATNNYELIYDSDASGKIDIVDVQTIAHILNNSVFGVTETSESATLAVPNYACSYEAPSNILLGAIDYTEENGSFEVVRGNNVKTININGKTELNCNSPLNYTGGIALYWEPISDADYYTVYRQGAGEDGVPIISSTTGVAGNITSFTARPLGSTKAPIEVSSTLWVDFPPIIHNKCEETDASTDPGITAEEFKYWVVATNRFGTSTSTIKQTAVVNCRRLPDATDITFIAQRNNNFFGKFNVEHPFAVIPIGSCDTSCFPVWTYAQNSGGTNVGISNKEGSITTKGSKPAGTGTEGQNDLSFTYKPKRDFIGKDTFKYTAKVLDPQSINDPTLWCSDEAEVTIYVIPEPPDVKVKHDVCPCPDEGEDQDITLTWEKIDGAKAYNVYEYNPSAASWDLKQTVDVTATDTSFEITLTPARGIVGSTSTTWATWTDSPGCVEGTSLLVQYRVSSVSMVENMEMENVINNIDITKDYLPCCAAITNPGTPTATKGGYCDPVTGAGVPNGVVTIAWNDVTSPADYDTYNVYRRGPYLTSGTPGAATWDEGFLDEVYSTGATLEYEDNPDGCLGCPNTSVFYEYYVTSVNNALCMEGVIPTGNSVGLEVQITCCNQPPDVVDQTEDNNLAFETEFEIKLEEAQLKAYDPDNSINLYTLIDTTEVTAAGGSIALTDSTTGIFEFTPPEGWYKLKDGLITFTWKARDNCNAESTATADIIVKPPPECLEYDYIICNAQIPWLTDQQDVAGIRKKIASLTQVPFMLNSKGVPSLRKRCGAYTVTRGLNPSVLALADDDCEFGP